MLNKYVQPLFADALNKIGISSPVDLIFEIPNNPENGDLSTNIAMRLIKELKKSPQIIAKEIISNISFDKDYIEYIDLAGPGFINIKFTDLFFAKCLGTITETGENFGKSNIGSGKKVNVEYVSV
ncbi:MAG: arginine--tRNA ligase, partial [FCB group bacterium]